MNQRAEPEDGSKVASSCGSGKRVRRVMWYVLLAIVLWLLVGSLFQRRVLFPRHLIAVPGEPAPGSGPEVIWLQTSAGEVEGWFLPGDGVSPAKPGPLVVFAHGNGELIDFWPRDLAGYRHLGVSVLLPEYRGYGRSAGSPSQVAITSDYAAFVDRVVARDDVDGGRLVYHGRSVGCGVVASLATQRMPTALILQSSFTSAADMAKRFLFPRPLMRDPFDVLRVVRAVDSPILILHGDRDRIIPPRHARRLHAAAPHSRLVFYPMGHNTPPPVQQYWQDIGSFLREAGIID